MTTERGRGYCAGVITRVPLHCYHEELRGTVEIEDYELVGMRLEGLAKLGWFWGKDNEQEFYKGSPP